jgi:hypothetical protein
MSEGVNGGDRSGASDGSVPGANRGPGGTSGGTLEFVCGLGLFALGFYFVFSRVVVFSYFPRWFGDHTFGITMIPFLIGVGMLFFNGRSIVGWALTGLGLLVIFGAVVASLTINYMPTSLFSTLMIFGCLAGGLGLMARALRDHG